MSRADSPEIVESPLGLFNAGPRGSLRIPSRQVSAVQAQVRNLGILAAVLFGGISAWEGRFEMDADGMSYLDIAEAYARRDWEQALNSVWSPLYSLTLMPVLRGLKPDAYWEFPLVQGMNFLVYLGAFAAFAYFLRELLRYRRWRASRDAPSAAVWPVPDWMVSAAGYAVFIWGALIAIGITNVGPHMALAALTFLTIGLLLKLTRHPETWWGWAALGLVLGLTYLARAQSLIFVVVYIALAVRVLPAGWLRVRRMVLRPMLAVGFFSLVASVYAVPLYAVKKQVAGADLVRLNYAWYVNDVFIRHWQGDPPYGAPVHPTRVLFTEPTVFEFNGPVGGTYPPWYDPSYWYEGVKPRFDPRGHGRRLVTNFRWEPFDHRAIFYWTSNVAMNILVAGFLLRWRLLPWSNVGAHAVLLIPALVALASYPTLTILPRRFLGTFLPLVWVGMVASVSWRLGRPRESRAATAVTIGVIVFHLALATAATGVRALKAVMAPSSHVMWRVAQSLHASGVPEGSKVAIMGDMAYGYWARLARVRIVAEVQEKFADEFWSASGERKRELASKLRAAGVRALVIHPRILTDTAVADSHGPWRWSDLGGTGYVALVLQ